MNETVLISRKDRKEYLVGIYHLGNSYFYYADCCQGIRKTCSASHWMLLPEQPNKNSDIETVKNPKDPFMEALAKTQKDMLLFFKFGKIIKINLK